MCVDIMDADPGPGCCANPNEIFWNIDRCDNGGLPPLDGVYCPPVDGMLILDYTFSL